MGLSTHSYWRIRSDTTNSTNTGPDDDITGGGEYIHFEASGGPHSDRILNTPVIDLTLGQVSAEFSFYFHAYGDDMGFTEVNISTDGGATFTSLAVLVGEYHSASSDPWLFASVDLTSFIGNMIILQWSSTTAGSPHGDFALDNVSVSSCMAIINGCTDATACNYDATATVDDGSCVFNDCLGVCGGADVVGAACDDGDPTTANDVYVGDWVHRCNCL